MFPLFSSQTSAASATLRSHVQPLEIGHNKMRAQLKDQVYSRGCKRLRGVTPGYVDACVETITVSSVYGCPHSTLTLEVEGRNANSREGMRVRELDSRVRLMAVPCPAVIGLLIVWRSHNVNARRTGTRRTLPSSTARGHAANGIEDSSSCSFCASVDPAPATRCWTVYDGRCA